MVEVVEKLTTLCQTVSVMESCTGGGISNAITNISGASEVFMFGAVTYSNSFKQKMGVDKKIIDKYSVYSPEVAREMSLKITTFTGSDYGIGVTGKLKRMDSHNLAGCDDIVYISIYDKNRDFYREEQVQVIKKSREENKKMVIQKIEELLLEILK